MVDWYMDDEEGDQEYLDLLREARNAVDAKYPRDGFVSIRKNIPQFSVYEWIRHHDVMFDLEKQLSDRCYQQEPFGSRKGEGLSNVLPDTSAD